MNATQWGLTVYTCVSFVLIKFSVLFLTWKVPFTIKVDKYIIVLQPLVSLTKTIPNMKQTSPQKYIALEVLCSIKKQTTKWYVRKCKQKCMNKNGPQK